ncbi:MAG: molybdopterin-synthase adenylyltransferase MoeB [Lachnospiraceae bacterium]|nr:molybdopterin-synthase adenylyltransferase MoeB [Lachnospiraceae bacterium]
MEITLDEIKELEEENICYVDVRSKVAYEHGHIPYALHLDNPSEDTFKMLPKDKLLIIYCSVGEKSLDIVKDLTKAGYCAVNLSGGYRAWLIETCQELSHAEINRYERQMILPEVGTEGQKKLKNSSVLIIGAGGLGSPAALYLAAAGIGRIGIADADKVSISNLQRQILHNINNIGVNKADSAKESMEKMNDCIEVEAYPYFITAQNITEIIEKYDFIIDAADNFETKFLINDACVIASKPFCHAGILRFEGQVMTYLPGKYPCYRCIFGEVPETGSIPSCGQAGIIGAVAGIVGCIQALEAIKYCLHAGELLVGKMLIINGLTMQFRMVGFGKKSPSCRVCGNKKDIFDISENASEYERKSSCLNT